MRKMLILAIVLGLGPVQAAEPSKAADPEVSNFFDQKMTAQTLDVSSLQDRYCGGKEGKWRSAGRMDLNNTEFVACVMYVLGAVDMIREWQKIDPVHALPVCVPRFADDDDDRQVF